MTATFVRPAAPLRAKAPGGFGGGLRSGWAVFLVVVSGVLVVTGALLPFVAVAAVVAVPVLYVRRRRRVA